MRLTSRADEHVINLKRTPQCRPAEVSTSVTLSGHSSAGASATPAGGFRNLREIQQPHMLLLIAHLHVFPPEFRGCFIKGGLINLSCSARGSRLQASAHRLLPVSQQNKTKEKNLK